MGDLGLGNVGLGDLGELGLGGRGRGRMRCRVGWKASASMRLIIMARDVRLSRSFCCTFCICVAFIDPHFHFLIPALL